MKVTRNELVLIPVFKAPQKDLVNLAIQIFTLQCMIDAWKVFGETIRIQAKRAKKLHSTCQQKRVEIHRQDDTARYRRLEQVTKLGEPLPTTHFLQNQINFI